MFGFSGCTEVHQTVPQAEEEADTGGDDYKSERHPLRSRCGSGGDLILTGSKIRPGRFLGPFSRAGVWSGGVSTPLLSFLGAPWSFLWGCCFPRAAWLAFHVPLGLEHGFSISALLIVGAGSFFVLGGCPEYCRLFSSIPGLYPTVYDNTNCL